MNKEELREAEEFLENEYGNDLPDVQCIAYDLTKFAAQVVDKRVKENIEEAYTDGFSDSKFDFDIENYLEL